MTNSQNLLLIIGMLGILYYFVIGRYWLKGLFSGLNLKHIDIILLKMRKIPINLILTELVKIKKSGILVGKDQLQVCYLADGDVTNVVDGLIYAKEKGINLSFKEAAQLDQQKTDIVMYLREN